MGLERLCGQIRLLLQQRLFQNASTSVHVSPSSPGVSSRGHQVCLPGLFSRMFLQEGSRLGAAHSQLAARRSLCTSTQPSRDVILYEHNGTRFTRLLAGFCGGQFLFWTYLSHFAYTGLRDTGAALEKAKSKASTTTTGLAGMWSFEMNLSSSAWRYGFTLGCLAIGGGIGGMGFLFCRRSVSQVVLHQGGRMVTVCTQSLMGPGRGRKITVPLSQVACHAHRQETPSFIPLRVKGHKFYFLLDKEGTVTNAKLFDVTVGAYRSL
ncbi:transmembrane protein 223 [Scomber scombrus]|uniref:transmembrane protein 223 n=1 Tax=Scomber scombrus TaxID=13677 RepID=UPI002DDB6F09|nr:transmembrane protein 223 [Scomber scombrus]